MADERETAGIDRRALIKKAAIGAGVVWAAPVADAIASPAAAAAASGWDRSSYTAGAIDCTAGTAVVCNTGSGTAVSPVSYNVLYAASGNPKNGTTVANGSIPALGSTGGCGTVNFSGALTTNGAGNYMVQFFQAPGHPGSGTLFTVQCSP